MSRIFNRIITFHVQGEIYNNEASPESIIRNYNWSIRNNMDGKIHIVATHDDHRGQIVKMIHLPKIHPWHKSDTELFAT